MNSLYWFWAIFNLLIGIWEVYAYTNRDKLTLSSESIWDKIKNGSTTFTSFWLDAWTEYCKVDSRYMKTYSSLEYVWYFELTNFVLAVCFITVLLLMKINKSYLKLILLLSIINCSLYFLTLIYEVFINDNGNNIIRENIKKYASTWKIIVYYLICSIWLILPIILYSKSSF